MARSGITTSDGVRPVSRSTLRFRCARPTLDAGLPRPRHGAGAHDRDAAWTSDVRVGNIMLDALATIVHMRRMQVQLTEEQVDALTERARAAHQPIAAVVREAVDALIAADQRSMRHERAVAAIGGFHSGLGDLAERHDEYLDGM